MEENTAWAADDLPELAITHGGVAWPELGVDPFSLGHTETLTLYWARGRPSLAFGREESHGFDDLYEAIPMGYTTLATLEKVAIVDRGRGLRVWPHTDRPTKANDLQRYQLILPPEGGSYLRLGSTWPFRYAYDEALALSARTNGPVLVCRVLTHENWH